MISYPVFESVLRQHILAKSVWQGKPPYRVTRILLKGAHPMTCLPSSRPHLLKVAVPPDMVN